MCSQLEKDSVNKICADLSNLSAILAFDGLAGLLTSKEISCYRFHKKERIEKGDVGVCGERTVPNIDTNCIHYLKDNVSPVRKLDDLFEGQSVWQKDYNFIKQLSQHNRLKRFQTETFDSNTAFQFVS